MLLSPNARTRFLEDHMGIRRNIVEKTVSNALRKKNKLSANIIIPSSGSFVLIPSWKPNCERFSGRFLTKRWPKIFAWTQYSFCLFGFFPGIISFFRHFSTFSFHSYKDSQKSWETCSKCSISYFISLILTTLLETKLWSVGSVSSQEPDSLFSIELYCFGRCTHLYSKVGPGSVLNCPCDSTVGITSDDIPSGLAHEPIVETCFCRCHVDRSLLDPLEMMEERFW